MLRGESSQRLEQPQVLAQPLPAYRVVLLPGRVAGCLTAHHRRGVDVDVARLQAGDYRSLDEAGNQREACANEPADTRQRPSVGDSVGVLGRVEVVLVRGEAKELLDL